MSGSGLMVPPHLAKQPQGMPMVFAQPFNDIQLLSLVASNLMNQQGGLTPDRAVDLAIEIVANAVVKHSKYNKLNEECEKIDKRLTLSQQS